MEDGLVFTRATGPRLQSETPVSLLERRRIVSQFWEDNGQALFDPVLCHLTVHRVEFRLVAESAPDQVKNCFHRRAGYTKSSSGRGGIAARYNPAL